MPPRYIPRQGDLVHLTFDPQSGHEQKGRRPALVISHQAFNKATGLTIVCPVTNTDAKIPFHVKIPSSVKNITGFIMTEQVKSVDFRAREVQKICEAPRDVLNEVLSLLDACIY
jgi:mRNA interferase MazF